MRIFTVHMPATGDAVTRSDRAVLLREGFATAAFAFGPLWLLRHRLWLALAAWLLAAAILALAASHGLLDAGAVTAIAFAGAIFLGLEGNAWRRARLVRGGLELAGIAAGGNAAEAETGFFARFGSAATAPGPTATGAAGEAGARTGAAVREGEAIIGLFPMPGARR